MSNTTDILQATRGDVEAFGRLIARYQNLVTSIALSILGDVAQSEDVAQEVFIKVWRELPRLRNSASFVGWVRQITRNAATDRLRARRPHIAVTSTLPDDRPDAHARLESLEEQNALAMAVEELTAEHREVILLYYREGRSVAQVARLLDLSEPAVRKRMSRARQQLREEVLERLGRFADETQPTAAFAVGVLAAAQKASQVAAGASVLSLVAVSVLGAALLLTGVWWFGRPDKPPEVAFATASSTPASQSTEPSARLDTADVSNDVLRKGGRILGDRPVVLEDEEQVESTSRDEEWEMRFINSDSGEAVAGVARLKGRVVYDGTPPKRLLLRRNADPYCATIEKRDPTTRIGENGGVADVLVMVRPPTGTPAPPLPSVTDIELTECMHQPRVTLMRPGVVRFHNDDPTLHNVHVYEGKETISNEAMPPRADPLEVRLDGAPGRVTRYELKCDVHPWERGIVFVTDSTFLAVTDESGAFEMTLPAGFATVTFAHEALGSTTKDAHVSGLTEVEVHFEPER